MDQTIQLLSLMGVLECVASSLPPGPLLRHLSEENSEKVFKGLQGIEGRLKAVIHRGIGEKEVLIAMHPTQHDVSSGC